MIGRFCETWPVTTLAVVQARMTSTRFPGKVLAPLLGEPMILRQLERVSKAQRIDALVVATSSDPTDDELAKILEAAGYRIFRGSLEDVLDRFVGAINSFEAENGETVDAVVRLTADCPLASPSVIDQVIEAFESLGSDYVSNTMTPTYPDGLDVEVVKASVLREVAAIATDPPEREHVTLGVYRRDQAYSILNFADRRNNSDSRWTVDTPEDFAFVTRIYTDLYPENHAFEYEDILEHLERHPEASRSGEISIRNAALIGLDTGAMNL